MGDSNSIDFMFELAFNKKLPSFYNSIFFPNSDTPLLVSEESKSIKIQKEVISVFDVPSHFKITKINLDATVGFKSVNQHKGYCIDLNESQNIEGYLKDQFGKTSRQALRSGKKRLETCFDISYKMYFGSIDKNKYDTLFIQFYDMLKLRADEKGIANKNLHHWDLYTSKVYEMILKKEASLFVIYDGETPINISLNMHLQDVVFLFITTYDIDYSKFRIGHTNWAWLIDWFLKNKVKIVDFSKGNTAYKKRWANKEYDFEYHLFYNNKSFISKQKAIVTSKKLKLKQFLRKQNINDFYYNTLDKLTRKQKYKHLKNHEIMAIDEFSKSENLNEIYIKHNDEFSFLRPIIYRYLYLSHTNIKDIQIYKSTQIRNVYFIKTETENLKITVQVSL